MKKDEIIIKRIIEILEEKGCLVGFTSLKRLEFYKPYFDKREKDYKDYINPFEVKLSDEEKEHYEDLNLITVLFPYLTTEKEDVLFKRFINNKDLHSFSIYTLSLDYHNVIKKILGEVTNLLSNEGYLGKVLVDTTPFSERCAAFDSKLGFLGRNGSLITEKYGSFCFIGLILTDLDVRNYFKEQVSPREVMDIKCLGCSNCIKACPTKALGEEYIKTKKCLSFLTQDKEPSNEEMDKIQGNMFGCDICQRVCPFNKKGTINYTKIEEFEITDELKNFKITDLFKMSKAQFRDFSKYAFSWRGKTLLQRNAILYEMKSYGEKDYEKYINLISSEKLKDTIKRYIEYKRGTDGTFK